MWKRLHLSPEAKIQKAKGLTIFEIRGWKSKHMAAYTFYWNHCYIKFLSSDTGLIFFLERIPWLKAPFWGLFFCPLSVWISDGITKYASVILENAEHLVQGDGIHFLGDFLKDLSANLVRMAMAFFNYLRFGAMRYDVGHILFSMLLLFRLKDASRVRGCLCSTQ